MRIATSGAGKIVQSGTLEVSLPLASDPTVHQQDTEPTQRPKVAERTSSQLLPGVVIRAQ